MSRHGKVVAKSFTAKDFVKAVEHKEATGGIMIRITLPTGVIYEVRYLPPPSPEDYSKWLYNRTLQIWPAFGILKK